jgi:hypothetical protein
MRQVSKVLGRHQSFKRETLDTKIEKTRWSFRKRLELQNCAADSPSLMKLRLIYSSTLAEKDLGQFLSAQDPLEFGDSAQGDQDNKH